MADAVGRDMERALRARYADAPDVPGTVRGNATLASMLARGSCRQFREDPVPEPILDLLCAAALASPTKSDLQQRDIVVLHAPETRAALSALVAGQAWVAKAPMLVVFCGNNRRQRLLHEWHDVPFANDHLDAVVNAVGDAAIALGAFVTAAEALGLGCCPISAVRNEAQAVSALLDLPAHVFPFAGLAIGYPAKQPEVSPRLPLGVTRHANRYAEEDLEVAVGQYDDWRRSVQPYAQQRLVAHYGESPNYGWSEDKVRQYSVPERADFGSFIQERGFVLT